MSAALVAGCGRRGALEEPGAVPADTGLAVSQPAPVPGEGNLLDPQSAGSQEPPQDRPAEAPRRPFFLDPLI